MSFLISLVLVLITFLGISETYVKIYKAIFTESDLAAIQMALVLGFLSTLVMATLILSRGISINPKAISIGTTNLPNFMYHPDFKKQYSRQDGKLLEENRNLK